VEKIGRGIPDNVVWLAGYKRRIYPPDMPRGRVIARAFVDLWTTGRVQYGVEGADEENALSLLEPVLLISHHLVLMAAE